MKYSKFGVPILRDIEIDELAQSFLMGFSSELLQVPSKLPVGSFLTWFKEEHKAEVYFENLGSNKNGNIIVGKTVFPERIIFFDKRLMNNEHLFRFTVGHEIGHWLLHGDRELLQEDSVPIREIDITEEDFWKKKQLLTTHDWVEHHAKIFSGSLIMPSISFSVALKAMQRENGVTKNIGQVYLDDSQTSKSEYWQIIDELHSFLVSQKNQ